MDFLQIAMMFIVADLMIFGFTYAVGDTPTLLGTSYEEFIGINVSNQTINPDEGNIQDMVDTSDKDILIASLGAVLNIFDWGLRMLKLMAWAAGSMILMPFTILDKIGAPFVIQMIVGIPLTIMQTIVFVSILSGRRMHK